jgi:hypothetical protein
MLQKAVLRTSGVKVIVALVHWMVHGDRTMWRALSLQM